MRSVTAFSPVSETDRERILRNLTDKRERILFGVEAPEEPRRGAGMRPGGAGGELVCPVCGKRGLTALGLKLHTARMHKETQGDTRERAERGGLRSGA
jgi:hypothetical protein